MLHSFPRVVAYAALLTGVVALPALAQNDHPGRPGTINYVEGEAAIGAQELTAQSPGTTELARDETLTTGTGKVELLLTPGVFLRVDDNSAVRMVSPDLANIEVAVDHGRAAVEVLDIQKENDIRIDVNDVSAQLLDKGLYEFDADHQKILVFHGKAEVYTHNQRSKVKVKGEHFVALDTGAALKAQEFDTRQYEDDFFRWCALRSGYLSEASVNAARTYIGNGPGWYGPGWSGPGWYWDPDFLAYTYVPADGIFYSPFGWGFYSPPLVYNSPYYYGGFHDRDEHHEHRFDDFHRPYGHGFEPEGGFEGRAGGFHGRGHR